MDDIISGIVSKERKSRIDLRVSEEEKNKILSNAKAAGLPLSEYCRKIALGYEPHAALTEDEVQALRDMKTLLQTVKGFNNALTEYAKGMTKEQRASFILDTRTINEWAKVVGEIYDFYDELKKKIKS